ncbi:Wadjet anti-phage system protein JetD domain-containing protein [Pseudarthrobacter sulfonivorans]|uniref:Wadjet anti-phage system protein JetD domain-containing protein n=1 Tax=Pseudarthrobacter sulfonivorans TaxID=121292 RepID=UPI0021047415|nr:DUF3322 and DUF2220 domain-containing protein [Pseudarthrobacter sulfonivorans]
MGGDARGAHGWTTLADLREQSQKAWSSGALLREVLEPGGLYPRRRPLKRPTAAALLRDYAAARAWAAELFAAVGPFTLETAEVGRTTVGSNQLPAAAVFAAVEDELAFIGKAREAAGFMELAGELCRLHPLFRGWALKRHHKLLELGSDALTAGRVALWLRENPEPGIYVRQLSMAGVHTKFVERHRQVIDQLLAAVGPAAGRPDAEANPDADANPGTDAGAETVEGPPSDFGEGDAALEEGAGRTPAARFARRHGFLHPPELVRFRLLDPNAGQFAGARDVTVTAEAFTSLRLMVDTVIATENQVNFLALPEQAGTLALYGGGYGFSSLRHADWLRDCRILYWGDVDTHGFRILDQLRAVHPHVQSVLMDEETLLAHRDAWVAEPAPSTAALSRLTPEESAMYVGLGNGRFGTGVRLEQELVNWDWALKRLSRDAPHTESLNLDP